MLSNAYFLAKFRFDTAENEPAKNLQNFAKFANFADPSPLTLIINSPAVGLRRRGRDVVGAAVELPERRRVRLLSRRGRRTARARCQFLGKFRHIFARFRLYQNEILQENMSLTAFFKLYKICILLHRCDLKIFAKSRFEKTAIFVRIQQENCKCRKIRKILSNFKNFSLRIW